MKERLIQSFPYVLAAALPLAGIILALLRFAEKRPQEGFQVAAAAVFGAFVYALLLA